MPTRPDKTSDTHKGSHYYHIMRPGLGQFVVEWRDPPPVGYTSAAWFWRDAQGSLYYGPYLCSALAYLAGVHMRTGGDGHANDT